MHLYLFPPTTLAYRTLLGVFLWSACASASAVSFDCTKARSASERLICDDPRLSALDDQLAALAAAGKQSAVNPRAYQRALDAAWSVRQQCTDIACVEHWYSQRIAALSRAQAEPESPERNKTTRPPAVAAPTQARAEVAAAAPANRSTPRAATAPVTSRSAKPNVSPGAQLQVIGEELGFHIPLTREDFLKRYNDSGGKCGVSQQLAGLKALARSAQSDCWTGSDCPTPAPGLRCKSLRTAYDSSGRIVLFTTKLSTVDAKNSTQGTRELGSIVEKFAEFGGSAVRTGDAGSGRVSASGSQGKFRLEAEVVPESGKQIGTFTLADQ